jgi:16S rRNA (cytosine1407-C5)-methyltransferase
MPLPPRFLERLSEIFPEPDAGRALIGMTTPRATSFRVNPFRADAPAVRSALDAAGIPFQPVPEVPDAFWVEPAWRPALLASPVYTDRWIYVQNVASMLPPLVLGARPGDNVLDLAAAPGSKTLQLAAALAGEGELVAVEAVKGRLMRLKRNLADYGASGVRCYLQDGIRAWRHRPEYFDRVLLDAPCSSEGRFQADEPETYAYWSERKIAEMERKQRQLLYSAIQCLRPGGLLVYSTCALAPEENEAVIDRMLRRFGDALSVVPPTMVIDGLIPPLAAWKKRRFQPGVAGARRLLPTSLTEGFFLCAIKKNRSTR